MGLQPFTFKSFCYCFSSIEDIKLSISWLICLFGIQRRDQAVNLTLYPERVWTIYRWRVNFRSDCWVVRSCIFSVVIFFACVPCKNLSYRSRQVALPSAFLRTHSNWWGAVIHYCFPSYVKWLMHSSLVVRDFSDFSLQSLHHSWVPIIFFLMYCETMYRAGWSCGNAVDLYTGVTRFECVPAYWLSWHIFQVFPWFLHSYAWYCFIKPRPLPSKLFSICHLAITYLFYAL
jgi:hypothetical protein